MARARNIKPGFFTNDSLAELPAVTRLFFAGLWTLADRDGRMEDRPRKLKAECMPYDDFDADAALNDLQRLGFVERYEASGARCIRVVNWDKHQNPHVKEQASTLPAPYKPGASPVQAPDKPGSCTEVAGLIPDSGFLIPDSLGRGEPSRADTRGHEPTKAGLACKAMKAKGLQQVNPGDPRLTALIAQGASVEEFESVAEDAVAKGKGWAWVLVALQGRRAEAAAIQLAPKPDQVASAAAVERTTAYLLEQRDTRATPEVAQAAVARLAQLRRQHALSRLGAEGASQEATA